LVRSLREEGIPVILISHTMQDVMEVADRIVVMRRGKVAANMPRAEATVDLIVKHIIGGTDVIA
jgi:ABC-type sugar transport system ATPase subunit